MKYLRQFLIIIMISLIGEVMHYFIPLPVPSSIYGMAILFVGLMTKIIPLDYVKDAGKLMIEIISGLNMASLVFFLRNTPIIYATRLSVTPANADI